MRYVVRPEKPPEALSAPAFRQMRNEFLAHLQIEPARRAQTRAAGRKLPPSTGLITSLEQVFDHRCAFCERQDIPLASYRFRPPGEAHPVYDSGREELFSYGWLADIWENLYPICQGCTPSHPTLFPVFGDQRAPCPSREGYKDIVDANTGKWPEHPSSALGDDPFVEKAVLLDPCLDNRLEEHLSAGEDGRLEPRTGRGKFTIDQFDLNREGLIKERSEVVASKKKELSNLIASLTSLAVNNPVHGVDVLQSLPRTIAFPGFCALLVLTRIRAQLDPSSNWAEVADARAIDSFRLPDNSPRWRLSKVMIENFKSIQSLEIIVHPYKEDFDAHLEEGEPEETVRSEAARRLNRVPAVLFLGENAAGKSTVLEAIALALLSPTGRSATGTRIANLLLDPHLLGGSGPPSDTGSICLTFTSDTGDTATRSLSLIRTDGFFSVSKPLDLHIPVFAYGAYRHYLDLIEQRGEDSDEGTNLFRWSTTLSNPDGWLYSLNSSQLARVVAALRAVFGKDGSFEWIEHSLKQPGHCVVVSKKNGHNAYTPLSAVSSGFRAILSLMCDVMSRLMDAPGFVSLQDSRAIVLIDEVEAHLHPRWKLRVMDGLREALPNVTFIASSHDPLCLRGMNDGEVKVLVRVPIDQGDIPVKVEELRDLPNMSLLTVEQLLTSDFFRLFDIDDPMTGSSMAALTDMLSKQVKHTEMSKADKRLFEAFASEIKSALPVGRSEVARLVQDAVAEYLVVASKPFSGERKGLRAETVSRIVRLLDGLDAQG